LLVDTTPELRIQLLGQGIGLVHAVLYTHAHADHLFGIDDLRIFSRYLGHDLPVYCERRVEKSIRRSFSYIFDPVLRQFPAGGVPRLAIHGITEEPFELLGARVVPIRVNHGHAPALGYRIGDIAYCTDVKSFPPESEARLQGLDTLVLDCLRPQPHATHLGLDEAVAVAQRIGARRTFFTHMSHRLEHESTNRQLPANIKLAYDGLSIPLVPNSP
jgi:phosphoribosyl 1,2-cyclic phosphate phosphodiesterase